MAIGGVNDVSSTNEFEPAMQAAVRAILRASRHLDSTDADVVRRVADPDSALEALDVMQAHLGATAGRDVNGSRSALIDIGSARSDLLAYQLARQRAMMGRLTESLTRLRATTSVADLADSIPIHSVELGYERALFSWVRDERWVPHAMHTLNGPTEAHAVVEAGTQVPRHTRELLEIDVVRGRRTILVLDAMTNPRVHRQLHDVTQSQTYVAAPVIARNHVVGLLHLDRNADTGTTDEFDRDLLMLFSQSVGAQLDQLLPQESHDPAQPANMGVASWAEVLTEREGEVLHLVAHGLTNAQIAERLFISEETTKTHMRKLLRKLGASNRSQAGAMYHRLTAGRGLPHPSNE
ncbi:hypothetical protein ASG90_01765 [Nocardioides sp. Soil797]|nr:hypothetical protein ASG90_01765 [Nocardioides sp. Soil797]